MESLKLCVTCLRYRPNIIVSDIYMQDLSTTAQTYSSKIHILQAELE